MPILAVAVILGLIQGVGEFLPISSSGHLILAQHLFGLTEPEMAFDVVLHLGTLAALFCFYRRPLAALCGELRFLPAALISPSRMRALYQERPDFQFGLQIVIASIPTAIIGLVFKKYLGPGMASVACVGMALLATGFLLRLVGNRGQTGRDRLTLRDALIIGLIQGVAVLPGLSRSGWTIGAGLLLGLERETAARFSFILSIPAIIGATILELRGDLSSTFAAADFLAGFLAAAICGFLALTLLRRILINGRLAVFSWWCWAAGGVALALVW
ncbi:MAG: undecaprenyl-diphosphate phosphatase [Desulfovibrionaceae bacterium]|nr:undecaprenyl-diphosphate phosphatase [Desulfovibrionaceae bacterium]